MKYALTLVCLLLAASLAGNFSQYLEVGTLRDRRPAGAVGRLRHDLPIYTLGTTDSPLILPKGLLLQESTPQGAATLGKRYGCEFLIVIHTDKMTFKQVLEADPAGGADKFEVPYSFDPDDPTWWLKRPNPAPERTPAESDAAPDAGSESGARPRH